MPPDEFELMIRRQFDVLYREGAESGLDYIASHDDVWFATGEEIVDHYLASGDTF
jgi:hypothetical protein